MVTVCMGSVTLAPLCTSTQCVIFVLGSGMTLVARQIGKMLQARDPKIINGSGTTYTCAMPYVTLCVFCYTYTVFYKEGGSCNGMVRERKDTYTYTCICTVVPFLLRRAFVCNGSNLCCWCVSVPSFFHRGHEVHEEIRAKHHVSFSTSVFQSYYSLFISLLSVFLPSSSLSGNCLWRQRKSRRVWASTVLFTSS